MATRRQPQQAQKSDSQGSFIVFLAMFLFHISRAAENHGVETTSDMSWWKTRTHCKDEYNSDLFIPDVVTSEENVFHLKNDTYYWVGALETSQWRWTDNTPLFEYRGYKPFDDDGYPKVDIPGNSVIECYQRCNITRHIGLKQRECYCIYQYGNDPELDNTSDQIPCPGNPEEKCGNDYGMSVYTTEIYFDIIQNIHQCAFAWKESTGTYTYLYISTGECSESRYSVCSNNGGKMLDESSSPQCKGNISFIHGRQKYQCNESFCVSCQHTSWQSSNQSCSLVTTQNANAENLLAFIDFNSTYWVGLHKSVTRKWNNETIFSLPSSGSVSEGQKCLALMYENNSGMAAEWIPCIEEHKALCINIEPKTAPPSTSQPPQDSTCCSKNLPTSETVDLTSPQIGNDDTSASEGMDTKKGSNYGIYIGIGIGGLLVLVLLFGLMVLFKRKEKLCFHKEEKEVSKFPSARENDSRHVPQTTATTSVESVVESGITSHQKTTGTIPGSNNEYAELSYFDDGRKPVNIFTNDVYNTTKPEKETEDQSNCYHHLGIGNGDEYDIAGFIGESNCRDSTYNHIGLTETKEREQSETETKEQKSEDYYNIGSTVICGYNQTSAMP